MLPSYLQWKHNGCAAGNGWNSPVNNAKWGTDYLNRTGTAKSNMYDKPARGNQVYHTDNDSQGQQLDGRNLYTVTFPKGQTPPVKGFWSVTLYNAETFLQQQPAGPLFRSARRTRTSSSTRTVR